MKKTLQALKAVSRKLFFSLIALVLFTLTANAQFEEKMSLNVAIGTVAPIGESDYYWSENDGVNFYEGTSPYIFSNYSPGLSLSGGIQYNFNRRFSLEGRVNTFYLWDWNYEQVLEDGSIESYGEGLELGFWHLGIGLAPKFYARPGKKVNPYGFFELNVSINDIIATFEPYYDEYDDVWVEEEPYEFFSGQLALGTYFGAGFDLNIISNIGLYVQSGYYITFLGSAMEENDEEFENFKAIKGEIGIKLNLFKSKQL
jgi:hypothetical protein